MCLYRPRGLGGRVHIDETSIAPFRGGAAAQLGGARSDGLQHRARALNIQAAVTPIGFTSFLFAWRWKQENTIGEMRPSLSSWRIKCISC